MELSYIREFVVLAETGNYLEAADALFIAQSSLSRHIKSIELDLGSPLFDRTTRKVVLNGFGQAFLAICQNRWWKIQEEYENVLQSYLSGSFLRDHRCLDSVHGPVQYHRCAGWL